MDDYNTGTNQVKKPSQRWVLPYVIHPCGKRLSESQVEHNLAAWNHSAGLTKDGGLASDKGENNLSVADCNY
jgi:hypothetical protein